jgi:STE24 endopeptidase
MNEDKATRFHRLRRRTAILAAGWSVLFLVYALTSGWSAGLRDTALRQIDASFCPQGLRAPAIASYIAVVLLLAHQVVAFPLAFVAGFWLERKYELSRQSVGEWCLDHVKAVAIAIIFGAPAAGSVYLTIVLWPDRWWIAATAGAVIVSVMLTWLAPLVIIPLFFKLVPLPAGELLTRIDALCQRVGAGRMDVFEWRLSEKTSRANAALTGFGRTRRIMLSDTLIRNYSADEIEVILAHELSHQVARDIWWAIAVEAVVVGLGFWVYSLLMAWAVPTWGLCRVTNPAALPLLVLTGMVTSTIALPLVNAISRWRERRADQFALDTTRNPAAFISAMKRLGASNLAEDDPSRFARLFFYTHPPMGDRLAFARAWASTHQAASST